MSEKEIQYPAVGSPSPRSVENKSPASVFPSPYNTSLPLPPGEVENQRRTRCATGLRFISTIHGLLNIAILVFLICVLISAGVADRDDGVRADASFNLRPSSVSLSAFHTRNAVLVFAVMGFIFVLLDTILHVSSLIQRSPPLFDLAFIGLMLGMAVIYFILGCCAAAWEEKMRDKLPNDLQHKGAAASAAAFLFLSMFAIIVNYIIRLTIPATPPPTMPSMTMNRSVSDLRTDPDILPRY